MKSFIVITDESESYIHDVLCSLLPLEKEEELIIFDNHSTDETVPNIISTIDPMMWLDEEQRYKFYINKTKENNDVIKEKVLKVTKGEPIFIDKKERFEISEVLNDAKNK